MIPKLTLPRKQWPVPPTTGIDPAMRSWITDITKAINDNSLQTERWANQQTPSAGMKQTGTQSLSGVGGQQAVMTGPWTKLWDETALLDTANNKIKIPSPGIWIAHANCFFTNVSSTNAGDNVYCLVDLIPNAGSGETTLPTGAVDYDNILLTGLLIGATGCSVSLPFYNFGREFSQSYLNVQAGVFNYSGAGTVSASAQITDLTLARIANVPSKVQ